MPHSETPQPILVQVERLSEHSSSPVLRVTTRRHPGMLIQGDTLKIWHDMASNALKELQSDNIREAMDSLEDLHTVFEAHLALYEETLRQYGLSLPYASYK